MCVTNLELVISAPDVWREGGESSEGKISERAWVYSFDSHQARLSYPHHRTDGGEALF
jgi:hypothetical protein